jgi:MFS family permease
VSISLAGAAFGSLSGTVLADSLGRIRAFAVDAVPLVIGAALCATATSSATILCGRFLVGIGIGLASALVPLYISEVAPTSVRGTLGSTNQLIICLGILGALVANVVLPVTAWRTMFWLSVVPALLLAAGSP